MTVKPNIVGAYELGSLVGTGTVGSAYRARHLETGQPAVVKFLLDDVAKEPEVQRRFVREVAVAEKLNHPNIVRHYDAGLHEDRIYFAMELVDSGTLKDVLRQRGILPWREAVEVAIQICAALEYAHKVRVIHRDLKPGNLFLSADGRVKVGDLGLARDLDNYRLTLEGQTVGTVRYMPPEQIAGDADLTGAVDLYALGCVLFEMLVGRPPFDGNSIIDIFEAHLYMEPTPPISLVRDCPEDLSELVLLLLSKDTASRPGNAAEVRSALFDILHNRPMQLAAHAPEETGIELASLSDAAAPNLTTRLHTNPPPWSQYASRRTMIIGGVIAAVILLAIMISQLG